MVSHADIIVSAILKLYCIVKFFSVKFHPYVSLLYDGMISVMVSLMGL